MSCLDNIIQIGDCDTASLSGLDLFDAPEISLKTLADTANEEYVSGLALANAKYDLAKTLVKNDVISALALNNITPIINDTYYQTGTFKTGTVLTAAALERGQTIYRTSQRGTLRKMIIHTIKVYPFATVNGVNLRIYDSYPNDGTGTVTTYSVNLVANQVNEFDVDYTVLGRYARVVLDDTSVAVASSYLTCMTGCGGSLPNDCGFTKGWNGTKEISAKEGYGIIVDFSCRCDYDELLCGLARTFIGEIVWLKTRILLMQEHLKTDRLNNWIVYDRTEAKDFLNDLENEYQTKWNVFYKSMPTLLTTYRDDCLQCKGIQWKANI